MNLTLRPTIYKRLTIEVVSKSYVPNFSQLLVEKLYFILLKWRKTLFYFGLLTLSLLYQFALMYFFTALLRTMYLIFGFY